MQEEIFIYETIEINKEILNIRTHIMSKGQVTFCKYIYWKWSKESESHLIKSSRNKEEKEPVPLEDVLIYYEETFGRGPATNEYDVAYYSNGQWSYRLDARDVCGTVIKWAVIE